MQLPQGLFLLTRKRKAGKPLVNADFFTMDEKPSVRILAIQPVVEDVIKYVLWGLEEEGIPAGVREVPGGSAKVLAKQAADGSQLNVGIGIDATKRVIVLHHRDLPSETPLFSLTAVEFQAPQLRRLGANAARLVKGNPLHFQDEPMNSGESELPAKLQQNELEIPSQQSLDRLEELIVRVVTEILNNSE